MADDSNQASDSSRPRRRTCEGCRRKKIKCNGAEPNCLQCSTSNSQCIWVVMNRSYGSSLEARILVLETRLLQIAPWAFEQPLRRISAVDNAPILDGAIPTLSLNGSEKKIKDTAMKETRAGKLQAQKRIVRLSCDSCRRKKIKCDKSKPKCSQCSVSGLQCTWFYENKYQVPSTEWQYAEELEAKLLQLEALASEAQLASSSALGSDFSVAEIPEFRYGKDVEFAYHPTSSIRGDDRQAFTNKQRGRSLHTPRRATSLPNPRPSNLSFPSQLTGFPPPPPLPTKDYDPAEKRRHREQQRLQREQVQLRRQKEGERMQQVQGQGYRRKEDNDYHADEPEWTHYTIYGDLRSRSLSSSRLTERDPVLSRPFSRPSSRPSSVHGSPLTPSSFSQVYFPPTSPHLSDLPSSSDVPFNLAASLSHLAKPLPLPSDLSHRLQRVAREREWGRTGNRYSGYGPYIGSSRMSSPRGIPSHRYSRPPSPRPSSGPSSMPSYSRQSPGPTFSRPSSRTSSRRSSFTSPAYAWYSPGSSPTFTTTEASGEAGWDYTSRNTEENGDSIGGNGSHISAASIKLKSMLRPPKLAPSPWQLYFTDWIQKQHASGIRKLNVAQAAKEAGQEYACLSVAEKEPYKRRSQAMKEAREKEYGAYMRTLTPEDIKRENTFRAEQWKAGLSLRRNIKDPNAPKKPLSAYFIFLKRIRAEPRLVSEIFEDETETTKQSVLAAAKWRSMTDAEKRPFLAQAEQDKVEYEAARRLYEESMTSI